MGQYQHDCPQKELDAALGAVVEDCVNAVGVDANTASRSLLQQVSGLTSATAAIALLEKVPATVFNAVVAILFAPMLAAAIGKALARNRLTLY